jgi:shikimate kinase
MTLMKQQNIILVGPMGAGKTSIGRHLARILGKDFFDTDDEIESQTGATLAWIFDIEGEEGFRKRESEVISQLVKKRNIVLSTGGGSVLMARNRELISARGTVLYLKASIAQQQRRTDKDKRRPLLRGGNSPELLEKLQAERGPLYEEVADHTFQTDSAPMKRIIQEIVSVLG